MSEALEVWLDGMQGDAAAGGLAAGHSLIGVLTRDRGTVRFAYAPQWLQHPQAFAIDPELPLDRGDFFPSQTAQGNFRVFDDSSPDRWGQTLMKRREALEAKDQGRAPRVVTAWDYLGGVQDVTRQGALRFRLAGTEPFISNDPLPAPPVARLRELEAVARELTAKRIDDLDALRRWLAVLVAPGASLGGARPKANFTDTDGSLWIAKFPAKDDDRDIGLWEFLTHTLAAKAGVEVPPARVLRFGKHFHTFCVQRFDRVTRRRSNNANNGNVGNPQHNGSGSQRRFYASAMTLLSKNESEGSSYVELAELIQRNGARSFVQQDLTQLFRRVAFNVAVGNRDDHLRNHGFLRTPAGWRLSPAFDVNPNIDKAEHVLNIDAASNLPSLTAVVDTAAWYGLSKDDGRKIVDDVVAVTRRWRAAAARAGIARADIELTAIAFEAATHQAGKAHG